MAEFSRMPRYDVRNDGAGPYGIFYCDSCGREFRSQPDVINTVAQDIGKQVGSNLLRKVPLFGGAIADSVMGDDPRYSYKLTPTQLDSAWKQAQVHFRECPTCKRIVCLSDFDAQSGFCQEDSPRTNEIAEARGQQTGAAIKGLAGAFGLGAALGNIGKAVEAANQAGANLARCPKDGALAAPGTKFCPECGTAMIQPAMSKCAQCGADLPVGVKFCPGCGAKTEQKPAATACPNCGTAAAGMKFCPECGTKIA
jgi:uncharacterized OB-fold protein